MNMLLNMAMFTHYSASFVQRKNNNNQVKLFLWKLIINHVDDVWLKIKHFVRNCAQTDLESSFIWLYSALTSYIILLYAGIYTCFYRLWLHKILCTYSLLFRWSFPVSAVSLHLIVSEEHRQILGQLKLVHS